MVILISIIIPLIFAVMLAKLIVKCIGEGIESARRSSYYSHKKQENKYRPVFTSYDYAKPVNKQPRVLDKKYERYGPFLVCGTVITGIDHGVRNLLIHEGITEIVGEEYCFYDSIELPSSLKCIHNANMFCSGSDIVTHTDTFVYHVKAEFGCGKRTVVFDLPKVHTKILMVPDFLCYDEKTRDEIEQFVKKTFEPYKGKFINLGYYDNNILKMPYPFKFRLEAAFERYTSGYRLSYNSIKNYRIFFETHAKKAARAACDKDDYRRLEFYFNEGFITEKMLGSVKEYARRKNAVRCMEVINNRGIDI